MYLIVLRVDLCFFFGGILRLELRILGYWEGGEYGVLMGWLCLEKGVVGIFPSSHM